MNSKSEWTLIQRMMAGDFDPDQPRDDMGRWTDTGASEGGYTEAPKVDKKVQRAIEKYPNPFNLSVEELTSAIKEVFPKGRRFRNVFEKCEFVVSKHRKKDGDTWVELVPVDPSKSRTVNVRFNAHGVRGERLNWVPINE